MFRLCSIGWRMFRWRSRWRPSVTRRHIDFLFGTCKDSAPFFTRSDDMPNSFNREETVMATNEPHVEVFMDYEAALVPGSGTVQLFDSNMQLIAEGDWLLPLSDESKVGDDV